MKAFLQPLGDRVLVKPFFEGTQKMVSGIIIPDTASEKPKKGHVIAIGDKTHGIKEGDMVLFARAGYDEYKHEDVTYYIVDGMYVLAVLLP